ncbi:hypothetical protein PVAP13_1NG199338 [Panicum virgatum]|uniref:Uncharacterized protein n=1 Tax=Panicum virgatum TaxID=38727 RepID=A0A8T0WYJ8_PANVG|nr:hypothetical protein PVAP13_1NG199338 [Panicum virgatum]
MEFLMSLTIKETSTETKVYFWLFNEQFEMTLQQFSVALGFYEICILDPNTLAERYEYDRSSWWNVISNELVSSKNSIVSIHNPTLRFLTKWLAMVVHSHTDLRLCSLPELQCLYAMANKIRFSPIRSMLAHWQKMISGRSPIDITPLVTRVARYVEAMDGAEVTFLPETETYRYEVGLDHFVQGHMMREGPVNSIFMCYPGYDREIQLPCPRLSLHSVRSLTLQMEKREPARWSVAGPQTRSKTRREQAGAGPSRRTPPVLASAQPGPSTQNMSFEEAYGHYTYDPYQACSSGFAGGQGPYYPTGHNGTQHPVHSGELGADFRLAV